MSEKRRPGQDEEQKRPKTAEEKQAEETRFAVGETAPGDIAERGRAVAPRDVADVAKGRAVRGLGGGETQYEVVSDGITGAGGATYSKGDILTAEQIGDEARVDKLLENGAIKEVE